MTRKMRLGVLLTIASSTACVGLPKTPDVFLCTPIWVEDSISKSSVFCRNVNSKEEITLPLRHIEIGMSGDDWKLTSQYIKDLKKVAWQHCTGGSVK